MREKLKKYVPALGYNWLSSLYDWAIRWTMPEEEFRSYLTKQIALRQGESVLDFGFGTASLTILLKEKTPEANIIGVDVDSNIRELALEKIQKAGLEIQLDLYDGITLPYSDDSFDKVISSLVFHHLDRTQKAQAFREIYRILKPNGELHIGDWGKAKHIGMRLVFLLVQLLDGFKTTSDNVKGLLPDIIKEAGFLNIKKTGFTNTFFGTYSYYKAEKLK